MKLYLGTLTQTSFNQILNEYPSKTDLIICDGRTADLNSLYEADLITNFHLFIKSWLYTKQDIDVLPHLLLRHNPYVTIFCDDCLDAKVGVIDYAKKVSQVCETLTQIAQEVIRLSPANPIVIKSMSPYMLCSFIRHGKTTGNLTHKYIGRTDEDLCDIGINELQSRNELKHYPISSTLFVSPMKRCQQTAKLLYPNLVGKSIEHLRECDFGDFECKNYKELSGRPDYQSWIESNGTLPFPNGESPSNFTKRCVQGFLHCMTTLTPPLPTHHTKWTTFVVHGGTIMSILSTLAQPKGDYFSYKVNNGDGYLCAYEFATQTLHILDVIKA